MKSYRFFIVLLICLHPWVTLTRAKEFLIVLSTKRNYAYPGAPCDYKLYEEWLKPVYIEAASKTGNASSRPILKKLEKMLEKLVPNKTATKAKRQIKLKVGDYWHVDDYDINEADTFAESICIGESAMQCANPVKDINGTLVGNCTCYDDGVDYKFELDQGFCRAQPGAFCIEDFRPEKLKYQIKCARSLTCKDSKCRGFRPIVDIFLFIGIVWSVIENI